MSGLILRVEHVTCFMPIEASVLTSDSVLSFRYGIIGSILTDTRSPLPVSDWTAFSRSVGSGASGSICLASASFRDVIVMATIEEALPRRSVSLVTRFDFVTIWILQSCSARIRRQRLVRRVCASAGG